MRTLLLSLALVLTVTVTAGAQAPDRSQPPAVRPAPELVLPPIQRHALSNGIDLLFMEKRDVPLIQMNVVIEVGTVDDPVGEAGLASLTAALIDEGAGELDALALADAFEFLGARFNVSTREHHTILSLRVPVERFEPAASLLADVLLRPHFDPEELERVRIDRLTSLIRRHDEPQSIAGTLFDLRLYGEDHPYGRSSIGNEAFLRNVTVEDVRAFYDRYYLPSRASIVMAGDVSPEALAAVDDALAMWSGEAPPRAELPDPPQVEAMKIYLVDKPGAAQSVIQIGHVGVARDTEDYYALNVLNTILGGSFTSRLNQNLREEKGYTYGARSTFDFRPFPGPFAAAASVFTGVTGPALQEFINELEGIQAPIPADEVQRAKNFLAMRYPQNFQSVSRIAGELAELVMFDLPDETLTSYPERVQAVTLDEVQAAASRYLDTDNLAIIVVGDRQQIEQDIRDLNLGPVEVMEVTDVLGVMPVLTEGAEG